MNIQLTSEDRLEILRYLGYRNSELSQQTEDDIADCILMTNDLKDVRSVWRLFDISYTEEGTLLNDTLFKGESLKKHLNGADKGVLLAVTIGNDFDAAVNRLMITNPSKGVILNSCGITLTEKAADELQKEIEGKLSDIKTGVRFSPGYGDLPIETQKDFIRLLDAERKAGIRLNENMLMNPLKSVSAVCAVIPK